MPAPLDVVLDRIGETQQPLPMPIAMFTGLAALVCTVLPWVRLMADRVDCIAHEGAHALVGSTFGRKVVGVVLKSDGDGTTLLRPSEGVGFILAVVVGYLGPSGFGLGAAKLISLGHIVAVLWVGLLLLAVLFPTVENGFGKVAVVVSGGLLFILIRYAAVGIQVLVAYGIAWLLLLSGIRTVVGHGLRASDAGKLAEWTHIPKVFWLSLWFVGAVMALGLGGSFML